LIQLSIGDLTGFTALVLILVAALLMAVRKSFVKSAGGLVLYRKAHIGVSTAAGLFLVIHIAYSFGYPISDGLILGYASTASAVMVWLTGTAFLERYRDTLYFHGTLTVVAVALIAVHASVSGANLPVIISIFVLASGIGASLAGMSRQVERLRG
jgi:hypothetical protein